MSASPNRQHLRQPLLTWSPVVLLSALLLSPMTAGALWHALAERFPQVFAALVDSTGDYAASDATPFATGSAISDDETHPADATDDARHETAEVPRRAALLSIPFSFAPGARVYVSALPDAVPAFSGGVVSGRAPPVLG